MKVKIFFTVVFVFLFLFCSISFSQKAALAPDTLPPADLPLENTPQFIFIGSDDQMNLAGLRAILDMVKDYANPAGTGRKTTFDGEPVRFSFYSNTCYSNPQWMQLHKRAHDEGHELGLHTDGHPFIGSDEQAISEFSLNLKKMTEVIIKDNGYWDNSISKWVDVFDTVVILDSSLFKGVRSPYLYVSDYVFDALDALNLRYDCSLEEGMSEDIISPNGFVFPYTADNGATDGWIYLSDTVKTIPNRLKSHAGKWEIPAYPLFWIPDSLRSKYGITRAGYDANKNENGTLIANGGKGEMGVSRDGKKVSGLDYDAWHVQYWTGHELAMTLLYNLKLRIDGNRVPMTFCIHSNYYDNYPDRLNGLKEFIDSALTYQQVRFVTGNQLIDWMENPIGLDGTAGGRTPKDSCVIVEYAVDCGFGLGDEIYYDTVCGEENIAQYYKGEIKSKRHCGEINAINSVKLTQNKEFSVTVVSNRLRILFPLEVKTADVFVFDVRGKIILQKNGIKNNELLPFENKNGVYFVRVNYGKNIKIQKISTYR
ncbi:MAG: T9SS type A sorting domain-containing protein [Chitinispirillales bacterium]|nr:T9SS type A sorting domain-containing protein [Chitinispirillales bacterium]